MADRPLHFRRLAASVLLLHDVKSRIAQVKAVINVFIALFVVISISTLAHGHKEWLIENAVIILFFIGLSKFLNGDTSNIVAGMTLWTVTIFSLSKAFYFDGLFDTSLLIYPFVLIFAAFLGSRVLIVPLVIFMVASFYFLAYAVSADILPMTVGTTHSVWIKAHDMALMLAVYGLGIILISRFIKGLFQKLAEQKEHNQIVRQNSERRILYDDLTGLPNGEKCKRDLDMRLATSPKDGFMLGFVTLHMNNFNWINSTLGHKFGDVVLKSLAERYQKLEDDKTTVYRTSGIEFTFVKRVPDYEALKDFCHQALRLTIMPLSNSDYDFEMTCALGVSVAPFDGESYDELQRKASFAVYKAKEDDPNSYHFYENDMEAIINRRLNLMQELKVAIESKEFELFYQPKVDLSNNMFVGAEALIRWRKDGAIVPPNEFIPVAEESGLIVEIGRWALETACAECARWQAMGLKGMAVAVNLSPVQFKRGNLPNHVFRSLQKAGLDPSLLELEITESLFIDDAEHIKQQIHAMTERGVNFAIDDFGTGYSNLNYLSKFNASTLKVDMSFVRNMLSNPQQQHIVNAIIKMSRVMELENVAEGVEDAETAAELLAQGCEYGQGYYWSPPLPSDQFLELVRAQYQAA